MISGSQAKAEPHNGRFPCCPPQSAQRVVYSMRLPTFTVPSPRRGIGCLCNPALARPDRRHRPYHGLPPIPGQGSPGPPPAVPRNAGLKAPMRAGRPRSQAAGSRCHAAMQSSKKTLHGAPCNALQRFLNSLSNLEIFGAEVGCSAQNAPNAAVIVGRPYKNRPEMSVLSHLTGQKWPKPDRPLSGDWGMFAGAACCSRHCAHQSG